MNCWFRSVRSVLLVVAGLVFFSDIWVVVDTVVAFPFFSSFRISLKVKNILGMKKDFSLTYRQVKYLRGKYFTMQTESDFRTFRTQSCLQFDNNSGFIADVVTRNSKIIKRSLMFIFHVNTSAISQLYIFKY